MRKRKRRKKERERYQKYLPSPDSWYLIGNPRQVQDLSAKGFLLMVGGEGVSAEAASAEVVKEEEEEEEEEVGDEKSFLALVDVGGETRTQ